MPDKLYIVVDRKLPTGLACAQVAHAATLASNRWKITEHTYIIVLKSTSTRLEGWLDDIEVFEGYEDFVGFYEPDLDDALTAVAFLNPPSHFFTSFKLFGEVN